jgi:hypothetical protein
MDKFKQSVKTCEEFSTLDVVMLAYHALPSQQQNSLT